MSRIRIANGILLVAMVAGAIVTYDMKYDAEMAVEGIVRLKADIAAEKDQIRTLTAEWSFLTQPARLQALVAEHADYFALQPFSPDQIASIDEIPFRGAAREGQAAQAPPPGGDAAVRAALARIAAGGALRGQR
jgi:hypothetical protein